MWQLKDQFNNAILSDGRKVMLSLSTGRVMTIAHIDNGCLRVVREKARHLHQKSNSYGFNYEALRNAKTCKHVVVLDDDGRYKVPIQEILTKGFFLHFKQEGFERQIFFPLDEIRKYREHVY